ETWVLFPALTPIVCPWASHLTSLSILETNGSYKSCRCTKQTSDFISPRRYESIEIVPFGGACRTTEIILKLKTGQKLCVNPKAPWMQKLLTKIRTFN
uniref:C-X-C motif chemokine ligand 13 n=1 Tax=Gopherus evgoodei TaxID=1825980 RepID=A0A8C4VPI7_9SAUR